MGQQIQHPFHEHPLILRENLRRTPYCAGCHERILGSAYSCKECWWVKFHKSCAELPRELQHPLHRKHPLKLLPEPPYNPKQFECKACEKTSEIKYRYGPFVYHCSLCKFDLDIKCASLPLTMEAESHDHPLTLVTKSISFTCDACGKEDRGTPHLCVICGICIHSKCASSPRTVKNICHKHPLNLTYSLQNDQSDHQFCQICVERVDLDYWVYHCSICNFVAHLNCATDRKIRDIDFLKESEDKGPIDDESISQSKYEDAELDESVDSIPYIVKMQIQHFSHKKHPLILNEDRRELNCDGCWEDILGSAYSCKDCGYDLHKSCAELPPELQHPLHRKHPLILLPRPPYEDSNKFKCYACEETSEIKYRSNLFVYHCSLCKFDLDIKCASLPLTMEAESHDHPLTPVKKSFPFTCDACGKDGRVMPYLCAKCGIWFHSKCASSPRTVKNIFHKHPLKLTYSLQNDQSDHRFCQICVERVDLDYWVYHCSICDFVAHLNCATDENIRDEDFVLESEDNEDAELDESVDSKPYIVKKTNLEGNGTQIDTEIKHFSHEHDLTLIDNLNINNQKCDGCVRPIFSPLYSCVQCNFFLHTSCANLPRKKLHPLHQHPLILLPKSFDKCDACMFWCNGFNYRCDKCDLCLDVECSLISDKLTHEGHEHPLFLSYTRNNLNCSACGDSQGNMFRCAKPKCEFTLNFSCATLPRKIWYRQHQHSFTLQFTVEDDSGEYYCDICEERRDPKYWFYYCAECSYPAHPKCILGRDPYVKLRR